MFFDSFSSYREISHFKAGQTLGRFAFTARSNPSPILSRRKADYPAHLARTDVRFREQDAPHAPATMGKKEKKRRKKGKKGKKGGKKGPGSIKSVIEPGPFSSEKQNRIVTAPRLSVILGAKNAGNLAYCAFKPNNFAPVKRPAASKPNPILALPAISQPRHPFSRLKLKINLCLPFGSS